jgi:porin
MRAWRATSKFVMSESGAFPIASLPVLATASAFALLQAAGPALATPPPDDFVETPVTGSPVTAPPGQTPAPTHAVSAPTTGANPDFIEAPFSPGPLAPTFSSTGESPTSFLTNINKDAALFGDMWGLRPALARLGITLTIQQTSELMGNVSGGTGQALVYQGLTTGTLQMDTQRAFGWYGGLFNVSGLWINGGNLSTETLSTLQTASGIEADPTVRLWELWYQQKFLDDKVDVKIGQQSIDQEFMVSQNSGYFVNTMMGWPMLPSADMPGGGPAYPLSALGVRARVHVTDAVTALAGVYNGSPVPTISGDPQQNNAHGVNFLLGQGVLAIAELQFAYPSLNMIVRPEDSDPLPGVYKLGFWYDSWQFASQQWADDGLLLANPASSGNPQTLYGNYAFYAVADQMIYRFEDDPGHNINLFVRPMFTPVQDRNLISFSVNAGLTLHQPFPWRGDDTFGLGMGYTHVSSGQQAFTNETAFYNPGTYVPARTDETFFEATYQYQATSWLQIQPDVQYVINPGAGLANSNNPNKRIGNETVLGVRINAQL